MVKYRYAIHNSDGEIMADTNDKDDIIGRFGQLLEHMGDWQLHMVKGRYVIDNSDGEIMVDTNDKDVIIDMFADLLEILEDNQLDLIPRNNNGTIPHNFWNMYLYGDIIPRLKKR